MVAGATAGDRIAIGLQSEREFFTAEIISVAQLLHGRTGKGGLSNGERRPDTLLASDVEQTSYLRFMTDEKSEVNIGKTSRSS
jgi:hypothetical protein